MMIPPSGQIEPSTLRDELERITNEYVGARVPEQGELVVRLRREAQHGAEIVRQAVPGRPETFRFTCFQFAFCLVDPPEEIVEICTRFPDIYPSSEFVLFLIEKHLLPARTELCADGDVVVYFDGERPVHAAVVEGATLVSKWGTAHTWRHGLAEVPSSYGNRVRAFRPIERDLAIEAFVTYAERRLGLGP